jgi:Thermostable hemolysin
MRRLLASFGIEFVKLAHADPALLVDNGVSWGNYYRRDPKVIAGAIEPAYLRLEPFLPAEHNGHLKELFARAHPCIRESLQ